MRIEILGALNVCANGAELLPTAPKLRTLISLLAVRRNEVVPTSEIATELWGAEPPRTANTALQVHIMQTRRLLVKDGPDAPDARQVVVTHRGGYSLNPAYVSCDAIEFERLAPQGFIQAERGDFREASATLSKALGMWTGSALVDVRRGPVLDFTRTALEELRSSALNRRIDADLRVGRHHQLLGELTAIVAQNDTHEGFHMQLMLAYSRVGRRRDALATYERLLRCLRRLGLAPSPQMLEMAQTLTHPTHTPRRDRLVQNVE